MPEIPNVVAGEPVEADWGNDIRDRSVQKYADLTALDFSQPLPQLGELAWLVDPGHLVVCTAVGPSVWTPVIDQDALTVQLDDYVQISGDTMTGTLVMTGPDNVFSGPVETYGDLDNNATTLPTSWADLLTFDVPAGRWLCIGTARAINNNSGTTDSAAFRFTKDGTPVVGSDQVIRAGGPWLLVVYIVETIDGPGTVAFQAQRSGATDDMTVTNKRTWGTQVLPGLTFLKQAP